MTSPQVQAIAAILTFLAALLAVWAAFRAPKLAAEFAEALRINNSIVEENRRLKMWIFSTLMQNRASILAVDSITALNMIDVVFLDSPEVRNARRDFMVASEAEPLVAISVIERYYSLIHCVVRDMGISEKLTISDIRSIYYPRDLGERAELDMLERQQRLSALRGENKP